MIKNLIMKFPKNTKHLAAGSTFPPLQSDVLRIYSMFYCPYAQRTRIVLNAKNVRHETVNIHLVDKPEWFFKVNPLAKVPTLQLNDKIMYESMITCDYLDETYPNPPLYSSDPWKKGVDRCFIEVFEVKVTRFFYKIFVGINDLQGLPEIIKSLKEGFDLFEKELEKRGTVFFLGDRPGMLDYAIFPWFERAPILQKFFPELNILEKERFPKLNQYFENMLKDEAAKSTVADFNDHVKYFRSKIEGNINYDVGASDDVVLLSSNL